ncbi:MAG: ubiquinone/menaquinone biosynthesis methyltransferase [Candidatus Desulfofervidaceae bacterium]|nr:ubiquinone/menaquinone biosynthesis methyltransferase [Candidatus Desulfofervidaceae bacterium]MDL1970939.1 ubiquinone/menaquinone biosynthesis methyltransferase [Candidatus Desulfofervidaceae bacterium]
MDKHADKQFVQQKFGQITRYYDFLNSLLSLGIDHYWRWRAVKELVNSSLLGDNKEVFLDLCAGTLPLSRALKRWTPFQGKIVALDFAQPMLVYGRKKWRDKDVWPVAGDALCLPLRDNSIDAVMVAFGVRNFTNRLAGLKEILRVLKPGGRALILEFSHPFNPFLKEIYFTYLNHLLPHIGGIISGDKEAYCYLADSIQAFYTPKEWMELMQRVGFTNIKHKYLTGGIVSVYMGEK